jgi:hypothetical protein
MWLAQIKKEKKEKITYANTKHSTVMGIVA